MKRLTAIVLVLIILVLNACGTLSNVKTSTIYVDKKGKVTSATIEPLPAEQYSEEEFKKSVNAAIATYNDSQEKEKIVLNTLKVKKGQATLRLTYATTKDYEAFTGRILFAGTVAEAMSAGYDFESEFIDASKSPVKSSVILKEAQEEKVIITNEPVQLQTLQDIMYISANATIIDKKTAQVEAEAGSMDNGITFGNAENTYIIYGEPKK